ncbi:AzlD domain-containing protein [Pandoraea sp. XJJ-1]|uniref:AzlD domain-containing protein n=1 Tax=Pandoraea cepalis TaxID=2508294 RepID=A0A5E4XWQ2_9BURK|nr:MULTISPECIES: AzlD domain-containing protein [Pandoraea]MBN9117185.1 AzlD domain-containing protein [Pandoraea sp.]MDN4572915.1 AzlD domain-containing protein [Pandoraea cepalis]MDN4577720.1 AzlD domain-containing protein [Pandoraea cepalis]OJY22804.1 MAG: branched-chain amino acid transporter [Pandoraea sp. 64-18]QBC32645.1 AzlD domain-containing protein [Pandoraea sp. XY-2]
MSTVEIWLSFVAMTAITIVTRTFFLLAGDRVTLPQRLQRALRYAPAAALAVIVVPEVLLLDHQFSLHLHNPKLAAAVAATGWFVWRRNMIEMIVVGMAVYTLCRLFL